MKNQKLFNYLHELGLIATDSDMQEIINIIKPMGKKQEQIDRLQLRIERIEAHLAEQHIPNNFGKLNHSEKPNSSEPDYTHLLPEGYEFCTEEDAEKWVKVEIILSVPESEQMQVGYIWNNPTIPSTNRYRPIRPIQYHISVHESVTAKPIQEVAEYYQPLFNLLHQEHNVIATQTELDEIIRTAESLRNSEPDPYQVDWEKAPDWANVHCFDEIGKGRWYGVLHNMGREGTWNQVDFKSNHTLPSGLDWKKSLRVNPKLK